MSQFSEAFIFRAVGADPADGTAREGALARTAFVPVRDAGAAAEAAAQLLGGGLDLIELYGFGPSAAAAVIAATHGRVPVGLVGVEDDERLRNRAIIFAAAGSDPQQDRYVFDHVGGRTTIVAVPEPAVAVAAAVGLVEQGAEHITMCGGLGPVPAAAVIEAIGDRVPVGAVMFGFESLPLAAAYRERFERALAAH